MNNIVTENEWQAALDKFRIKEKELTRLKDQLNAERRRLPRTLIEKTYEFTGPTGKVGLLHLFEGRRQLILYHFMYAPEAQLGCTGCSMVVDNIAHIAHFHARQTSIALVARAPLPTLLAFKQRMGWEIPWYSSYQSEFNYDFGVSSDKGEMFGVSVFFREDDKIYRTYFTSLRGVEHLGTVWSYLDLTPWGRQELWEDSPEAVPQSAPYQWWRLHDSYDLGEGNTCAQHARQ